LEILFFWGGGFGFGFFFFFSVNKENLVAMFGRKQPKKSDSTRYYEVLGVCDCDAGGAEESLQESGHQESS